MMCSRTGPSHRICFHFLKSLHYDMHITSLAREPLSDPAVSTAGREPNKIQLSVPLVGSQTRGLRVQHCYSSALQNGDEYAEIVYFPI